jgi:hypothetical protein
MILLRGGGVLDGSSSSSRVFKWGPKISFFGMCVV